MIYDVIRRAPFRSSLEPISPHAREYDDVTRKKMSEKKDGGSVAFLAFYTNNVQSHSTCRTNSSLRNGSTQSSGQRNATEEAEEAARSVGERQLTRGPAQLSGSTLLES